MPNILVVDDDVNIRRIVTYTLTDDSPYHVTPLSSGEAALLHISRHPVDLLFTDIRMPGMSGLDLVQQVRELDMKMAVIVFTVSPEDLSPDRAAALKIDCLLAKPVSPDQLRMAVDLLLDPQRLLPKVLPKGKGTDNDQPLESKVSLQLQPGASFGRGRAFSAQQINAMHACLREFSQEADVYCALLADMSGILLTHWTRLNDLNVTNIAALAAGNSLALTDIGRSLGKKHPAPRMVIHEGEHQSILMTQMGNLLVLLAIGKEASLGWARMSLMRTCEEIGKIIQG